MYPSHLHQLPRRQGPSHGRVLLLCSTVKTLLRLNDAPDFFCASNDTCQVYHN